MKEVSVKIISNKSLTKDIYCLTLKGDIKDISRPGSFVNVKIPNFYLRRPISIADISNDKLTLIYKVVGKGTDKLTKLKNNLNIITDLGNGFNIKNAKNNNLLVGGGVGIPPLFYLAKALIKAKKNVTVILGFNKKSEIFYVNEFKKLGVKVIITTLDGSVGVKGLVTDVIKKIKYDYVYACGPIPMLKTIYKIKPIGEYSLEERMGCGFGACMGCSILTKSGSKSVCKDGPVFKAEDLLW